MVSIEESILLSELRESLKSISTNELGDYLLIAYLRACDMDVNKAKVMFEKFLELQESLTGSKQVDFTNHNTLKEISDDIRYKFLGTDNKGRLVVWVPTGRFNTRKHIENGLKEKFCLHCFKCVDDIFHRLYQEGEKTGKHQTIVAIADFEELSFKKLSHFETLQTILSLIKNLQVLAPLLDKVYIVNAPWITGYLSKMAKPILTSGTTSKLQLISSNRMDCQKFLQECIPVDVLPTEYGGTGQAVFPAK